MKKSLTRKLETTYYYKDGQRIEGVHENISGHVSDVSGDVSKISGNASGVYGDVSKISGDVSGVYGNVNGISGNIDDCEITKEERQNGVNVKDLII